MRLNAAQSETPNQAAIVKRNQFAMVVCDLDIETMIDQDNLRRINADSPAL